MDEYANSVYTAVYSDIHVYEMLCRGVAVMKRRSDSWLNATQLLKVAGIEKGRRTKILEREVLTGVHEKIQGGYGKYQGTWVPFARGVQLCRQYAVYDHVRAILEHDPTASGTRPDNTLSKADVRRFMKIAQTGAVRVTNGGPAASIKRDRLVGPAHPNIKRYRTASSTATSPLNSDILGGYQPATVAGPGHGAPSTPGYLHDDRVESLAQLASSASHFQHGLYSSPALCYSGDVPANPPSLACRPRAGIDELSSQTIAECDDSAERDDRTRLMQVFLNEDPNFVPDWLELDGSGDGKVSTAEGGAARRRINLDLAIDDQGHTSVHWAAALARIHVLDLFLCRGADPRRLNYDSESALVRAVQVTNNYETQTFPDLLELLHDTIPLTDKCNRTVLHHIALAAGAEGREKAARYYADCLLSWIVRLAGGYQIDADEGEADEAEPAAAQVDASSRSSHSSSDEPAKALPTPNQSSSPNGHPQTQTQSTEKTQALGDEDPLDGSGESGANADFAAFLNLQDVHGDTALNIAARTGDRAMVRMLLNAGASPTIQNRVGLCPLDFGVEQIAQTGDDSDLWEGDLAGVPDVAMSPTPSGRTRALLPQTPLRSAVRGANKNLLSSLMASCSAQSPMQGRGSGHDGASGLPGDLWSPVSAEQRVHQSVAKIQRLMADLESDFAGEIKTKQAHFDEIKQQLRNTTIELARARETIHKLHSKASQLSEIKLRVGYLEETLGRETSAVREAIAGLPADSKPRQDLEALLATLLGGTAPNGVPQDGDVDVELPRIPGNALDPQPEDDAAAADAEQDPAKLFAMVERLRIVNQVYARRDALLRERVAVLRQRADLSHSERQFRQVIASCCDMSEADVDLWIDKFVAALESGGPSDGEEPQPAAAPGASSLSM